MNIRTDTIPHALEDLRKGRDAGEKTPNRIVLASGETLDVQNEGPGGWIRVVRHSAAIE